MKNFDSRTYSVNDFLEWYDNKQLELSPKFQRRSVWTDTARSYLMDTIVEGKPIAKLFLRQKLNVQTRKSIREVVDGQQRLRTILSFLKDGFVISKRHNEKYGGLYFSQLNQTDDDIQAHILNYELAVDLLVNMSDAEVLDVFGRLNSYAVTLNEQERLNANYFSQFKTLADKIAHKYNHFWTENKILSSQNILRMYDVQMTADLLIAMIEGVKSKKQIKKYYELYEKEFDEDIKGLENRFDNTIKVIEEIFSGTIKQREIKRNHVFYSLFVSIYHLLYGIDNLAADRIDIKPNYYARILNNLDVIEKIFNIENKDNLNKDEKQFLEDCRRATTDTKVRIRRSEFILNVIGRSQNVS